MRPSASPNSLREMRVHLDQPGHHHVAAGIDRRDRYAGRRDDRPPARCDCRESRCRRCVRSDAVRAVEQAAGMHDRCGPRGIDGRHVRLTGTSVDARLQVGDVDELEAGRRFDRAIASNRRPTTANWRVSIEIAARRSGHIAGRRRRHDVQQRRPSRTPSSSRRATTPVRRCSRVPIERCAMGFERRSGAAGRRHQQQLVGAFAEPARVRLQRRQRDHTLRRPGRPAGSRIGA